jgi:hypothetical protein
MSLFAAVQTRDSTPATRLLAAGRKRYATLPLEPAEVVDAILNEDLVGLKAFCVAAGT